MYHATQGDYRVFETQAEASDRHHEALDHSTAVLPAARFSHQIYYPFCNRGAEGRGASPSKAHDRYLPRPHAWRYRDYVVRSFNADKPYDRFLLEQIARDEQADYEHASEITPEIYDNLVATGTTTSSSSSSTACASG
jgi:hypothetical protein